MKKRLFGRMLSLLLAVVMLVGILPAAAGAEKTNRFVLVAEAEGRLVIAPEYVNFKPDATVEQALASSGHRFEGLNEGMVTAIDGVAASYLRSDQKGSYELTQPASQVSHYRFASNTDNARPSQDLMDLMTVMADYQLETPDVRQAAKAAYEEAAAHFVGADGVTAQQYAQGITEAIRAYKDSQSGQTYAVTFDGFTQAQYAGIAITAENEHGKVFNDEDGDSILQLPVGHYQFQISWEGNRIAGSIDVVNSPVNVTSKFLNEELLEKNAMAFSDANGTDFEGGKFSVGTWNGRELTVSVPDSFTGTVFTYVKAAATGSAATLEACYTNTAGETVTKALAFESNEVGPQQVLSRGANGNVVIYRASVKEEHDYTVSQDYTVNFTRIPTLKEIKVVDQEQRPQASKEVFEPATMAYTYQVLNTTKELTITPVPLLPEYEVLVNGQDASAGVTVPVNGETDVNVTVQSAGVSSTYVLHVVPGEGKTITFKTLASTLKVYNSNNQELPFTKMTGNDEYNRYLYTLVPNESYHYVATRNDYFFTEDTFTLGQESVITVDVPVADWLKNTTIRKGRVSSTAEYPFDKPFQSDVHHYTMQIPDNMSMMYIWAEAIPQDVQIEQIYYTITKSEATHHQEKKQLIPSGDAKGSSMSDILLLKNALGNQFVVRLSKTEDGSGIRFYQDYVFDISRELNLQGLTVSDGQNPVLLYQKAEGKQGFKSEIHEYTITVPAALQTLELAPKVYDKTAQNMAYGQEETGYRISVNGTDANTGAVQTVLNGTLEPETITVTLSNILAPGNTTEYTVEVKKAAPLSVTMNCQPSDALLFVEEHTTHGRLWPENGKIQLSEGFTYDYTLTKPGYVGCGGTMAATRNEQNQLVLQLDTKQIPATEGPDGAAVTVPMQLEIAAENTSLDKNIVSQWPNFRGNDNHNAVTSAPTPYHADDTALYWAVKIGKGWGGNALGCPIVVEDDLITYAGKKIYRLDAMTGAVLAEGDMYTMSSFSIIPPAYAEGMIFMQLSNGVIQAFDAKTLKSLWIYRDPLKGQCNTPITVHNGMLYTGFWNSETKPANFVCLNINDEDPGSPNEEKVATWRITQKGGFYWAGAYACDDYILVGTDDGENSYSSQTSRLLMLDSRTGALLDSWDNLNADIRSNVSYDPQTNAFYFTSKGGNFYSVQTSKENGSWKLTNKWTVALQNGQGGTAMSTSTPAIHNGRAYVGVSGSSQFGAYSGHNITVIDLASKHIAYSVATAGYPQTSGLISTAYEEKTGYVYVYFLDNMTPGALRVLRDKKGQMEPDYLVEEKDGKAAYPVFTPNGEQAQYAICSPLTDKYGTLYFKNDSCYLMAVGSTIINLKVTKQPTKTTYQVGDTFNPEGITVIATYANGQTRDVTKYMAWSKDPMTSTTKEVSGEFPYMMYQNKENGNRMDVGVPVLKPHVEIAVTVGGDAVLLGDVNGDKVVDEADAAAILEAEVGNQKLEAAVADVSGDGRVDSNDAVLIAQYVAKKLDHFPAEKK